MHYQFPVHKIKTIGLCLPRVLDHLLFQVIVELWEFVNGLHIVFCLWHAKGYIELVFFYQLVLEKVSFDHCKLFNRGISYFKSQCSSNVLQIKEMRAEMIPHSSHLLGYGFADFLLWFFNFKKSLIGIYIPDLKFYKLNAKSVSSL